MTTSAFDAVTSHGPIKLLVVLIELHGGTGVFCRNLARALKKSFPDEFRIELIVMRSGSITEDDRALFDRVDELDVSIHDDWRRFTETLPNALKLKRAIKRSDADIIFALHLWPSLVIPAIARKRCVVLSVHSHLSTLLRKHFSRPFVRFLIRRRFKKRTVVVPTKAIADDLATNFGVGSAKIISHGIDIARIPELAEQPVSDLPAQPYIAAVGHLYPAKDYPTLLRAFAIARAKGFSRNLVIIGEGPEEAAIKQLANSLSITSHVIFPGRRDNPYPYLKHADFFVLSSRSEAFGLAILEAMALDLPIIATDTAGPAEILDHGKYGTIIPARDPDALAAALLNAPQSAHLKDLSKMRVEQFTLEKMAVAYRELFQSCLR